MNRKRKGSRRAAPSGSSPASRPETPVEEEIDLHGMAIDEAIALVEMALGRYRSRPGTCLRIIHGHSSGRPDPTTGVRADSIKGTLHRNLASVWKRRVRAFRQEPGNPGATLIWPA